MGLKKKGNLEGGGRGGGVSDFGISSDFWNFYTRGMRE